MDPEATSTRGWNPLAEEPPTEKVFSCKVFAGSVEEIFTVITFEDGSFEVLDGPRLADSQPTSTKEG